MLKTADRHQHRIPGSAMQIRKLWAISRHGNSQMLKNTWLMKPPMAQ
jgi:hypothetical protein